MTKKEVEVVPVIDDINKAPSPIEAYQMILGNGGSLENIEKMMELQERWEKMEAKKAYVQAMASFKENPPRS